MRGYLAAVLLLTAGTANASLILTADGVVTQGCNDCGPTSYDLFGLGQNVDLTGQAFSIRYNISDELLATTPLTNTFGLSLVYMDNVAEHLTCSVTLNNHTYDLPAILSARENDAVRFRSELRVVDLSDHTVVEYGTSGFDGTIGSFRVAQVPEPGTLALMTAGLLGIALTRRRSRVTA